MGIQLHNLHKISSEMLSVNSKILDIYTPVTWMSRNTVEGIVTWRPNFESVTKKACKGHFRDVMFLCFKASLGEQPFIWEWGLHSLFYFHITVNPAGVVLREVKCKTEMACSRRSDSGAKRKERRAKNVLFYAGRSLNFRCAPLSERLKQATLKRLICIMFACWSWICRAARVKRLFGRATLSKGIPVVEAAALRTSWAFIICHRLKTQILQLFKVKRPLFCSIRSKMAGKSV